MMHAPSRSIFFSISFSFRENNGQNNRLVHPSLLDCHYYEMTNSTILQSFDSGETKNVTPKRLTRTPGWFSNSTHTTDHKQVISVAPVFFAVGHVSDVASILFIF